MAAQRIEQPIRIEAAGTPTKIISEFVGRVASSTDAVSIAIMESPTGWSEPGQTPEFDEYTVVLDGCLTVETRWHVGDRGRPSDPSPRGRVGAVFDARAERRALRLGVHAGVHTRHGAPRLKRRLATAPPRRGSRPTMRRR